MAIAQRSWSTSFARWVDRSATSLDLVEYPDVAVTATDEHLDRRQDGAQRRVDSPGINLAVGLEIWGRTTP